MGRSFALDSGAPVPADPAAFAGIGMMGGPMSVNDDAAVDRAGVRPAARRGRRACPGDRALPRRPAPREGAGRAGDARAGHRDRLGRRRRRRTRRRAASGSAGATRFATFQWHYDAFALPPGATRVLTNSFNANQAYVVDDRHIGFQCHIEMTRETGRDVAAERRRRAAAGVEQAPCRSAADIRRDLPARLDALHAVADDVYARWASGLAALTHADPRAARSPHQPDRRGRGRRASGGGVEGAARKRARCGRDADRRRSRRRRHQADPRRRQRRGDRARGSAARGRAARDVEARDRRRPGGDRDARLSRRSARVDRRRVALVARVARGRQAACVADRGRRRRHRA